MVAGDPPAELRTLSIHETRRARRAHEPALVSVRLDGVTLDEAADALSRTLHAAGVY